MGISDSMGCPREEAKEERRNEPHPRPRRRALRTELQLQTVPATIYTNPSIFGITADRPSQSRSYHPGAQNPEGQWVRVYGRAAIPQAIFKDHMVPLYDESWENSINISRTSVSVFVSPDRSLQGGGVVNVACLHV